LTKQMEKYSNRAAKKRAGYTRGEYVDMRVVMSETKK